MKQLYVSAFLLLAILLPDTSLYAQMGGFPSAGQGGGRQAPKMGKMYGKVIDNKTGRPVDVASVSLLQNNKGKKVLVQGAVTESNGEFSLENLPMMGQFELIITALGYKDYKQTVAFDMAALMKAGGGARSGQSGDAGGIPEGATAALDAINKDLGNIRLEQTTKALEGVTVTAKVPAFSLQGEKKVFNVDQNLTSQGGTAADVMKNVPGVLVDADNKVTIRNSAPQLLVDGRQSPLQLDQIPADAIESVEVITNPSAKFDAEGGVGGVLNIVLKKNRKKGYNGTVRAGVDSRGGGNAGGDFNVRSGKINVSASGFGNLHRNLTTATTDRTDFFAAPDVHTFQDDKNNMRGAFIMGRLGLDYFVTNRTTLSIGANRMHGEFKPDDNIDVSIDSLFGTGDRGAWGSRSTTGKNSFDMIGGSFGVKHLFPRAGEEWTLDLNVNASKNANESRFVTNSYGDAAHTDMREQSQLRTAGNGMNNFYTLQSDYVKPLGGKNKVEMGVKATVRQVESNVYNYFDSLGSFIEIPNNNSEYKNWDAVYAAYGSYSGNFNANNSFQIGLRAESSQYTGELTRRDTSFTIQYPISLFPSVFYTRKMAHDQQLQFSYRRGINRPNFFQLLPFTDYTDPLNIRQGNPALQPEFTNSVELSYMKNFTRSNYVMVSVYERHSDNLITSYQSLSTNPFTGEPAIITSYINANASDKYGAEITVGWDLAKWWSTTTNLNLYNGQLTSGTGTSSSYFSGFGKLNNQFKLAKGWSAQLSGAYQSRTNLLPDQKSGGWGGGRGGGGGGGMFGPQSSSNAQGYLDAQWYVDASVRYSFLKNDAASLSLSVNDVFGTRKFIQHSENEYFVQDYSRLINPTMVRLNFNYRFGKIDTDLFRRKNLKGQMEGMQDATMGM
jgi:outer membrane receptor protein involved in Fe transport